MYVVPREGGGVVACENLCFSIQGEGRSCILHIILKFCTNYNICKLGNITP